MRVNDVTSSDFFVMMTNYRKFDSSLRRAPRLAKNYRRILCLLPAKRSTFVSLSP
jgi:hypothetical protein